MRQYNERELNDIAAQLHHWPITASGTEGYRTAEVTLGGVDTRELSSGSMESKRVPGLYFIGEVVDVTGWLGGYNFQWAWASGHARSEEHTSELQSLMRNPYAVFCLKKKKHNNEPTTDTEAIIRTNRKQ